MHTTCSVHLILLGDTFPVTGILCYLQYFQPNEGPATGIRYSPLPSFIRPPLVIHNSVPLHSVATRPQQLTQRLTTNRSRREMRRKPSVCDRKSNCWPWDDDFKHEMLRNRSNILWQSVTKFGNELTRSFVIRRDADYTGLHNKRVTLVHVA